MNLPALQTPQFGTPKQRRRPQTATIEDLKTLQNPYDPTITERMIFPPNKWRLKDVMFILTLADQPIRGGKPLLEQYQDMTGTSPSKHPQHNHTHATRQATSHVQFSK